MLAFLPAVHPSTTMNAIQGAIAVRRERQKRRERRLSQIKRASSRNNSANAASLGLSDPESLDARSDEDESPKAPKSDTSLTAFHLGVVFILLGFLLVFSSIINEDWSQLLGVGTTLILVGLLMVMVNRILTQKEEEELTKYVHNRLGRTRSGYALGKDLEAREEQYRMRLARKAQLQKQQQQQYLLIREDPNRLSVRRSASIRSNQRTPSIRSNASRRSSSKSNKESRATSPLPPSSKASTPSDVKVLDNDCLAAIKLEVVQEVEPNSNSTPAPSDNVIKNAIDQKATEQKKETIIALVTTPPADDDMKETEASNA